MVASIGASDSIRTFDGGNFSGSDGGSGGGGADVWGQVRRQRRKKDKTADSRGWEGKEGSTSTSIGPGISLALRSHLTLAVLHDSGWYRYRHASAAVPPTGTATSDQTLGSVASRRDGDGSDSYGWGKNGGCALAMER